jgi:hypothetical protein
MKGASWLDYFKLRASYGVLGSTTYSAENSFAAYLFRDEWLVSGTADLSDLNLIAALRATGNPDIGFQRSHELNAGFDALFLDRSLSLSLGYFRNNLTGGFANLFDVTPGVMGTAVSLAMRNYREIVSSGFEGEINWRKRFNGFNVSLGGNFTHGRSRMTREPDPVYPAGYEGLAKIRNFGDVKGYTMIGTYDGMADVASSPKQSFGSVHAGDLKYLDANSDNRIDDRDTRVIANTSPSWQYGITLQLEWKGFNLDVLGYGLAGFDRVLNTKYYQIFGNRKYSNVLVDGLPNGRPHPQLSAERSDNNFVNSDYWVVDGGWFKLRNVELGYTFNHKLTSKIGINRFKIFLRGHNLATISKIKDLDPESLVAGVNNYPLMTTITGGISLSF